MRYFRLVALTGGLLALSTCGDPESPIVAGPPFFSAAIDGTSWVPDTASCLVISNSIGTAAAIVASRLVPAQERQEIAILFPGSLATRQFPLVDLNGHAAAWFMVSSVNGGVNDLPLAYWSTSAQPGLLSITGVNRTDSLMTGTFRFEGATIPDTTPHRVVTGQFRLRYQVLLAP